MQLASIGFKNLPELLHKLYKPFPGPCVPLEFSAQSANACNPSLKGCCKACNRSCSEGRLS